MSERSSKPPTHSLFGGLIRLQAHVGNPLFWIGPVWAVACGVIASGGFDPSADDWLHLGLLALLVDGGWGSLWSALIATDWATPLHQWRRWHEGERSIPITALPYAQPDAPGARMIRWLAQLRSWWRRVLRPQAGGALSTVAVGLAFTLILSLLLGERLVLLSLAAIAITQVVLIWKRGRGLPAPGWSALTLIGLAWLAGHTLFAPLTPISAGLALAFALAWGSSGRSGTRGDYTLIALAHVLAMGLLVLTRRPLAAGAVGILVVPQLALLPWMAPGDAVSWYVRYTRPWLMGAMVMAALAL